ncbi:MAG: hypothetical protein L6R42_001279 [Xanthoria sp. 1 TBL-2021]|nr:MAG: hypothetical protein L6R42_001279 [Xanthoria sp. 1 TBL-2021]
MSPVPMDPRQESYTRSFASTRRGLEAQLGFYDGRNPSSRVNTADHPPTYSNTPWQSVPSHALAPESSYATAGEDKPTPSSVTSSASQVSSKPSSGVTVGQGLIASSPQQARTNIFNLAPTSSDRDRVDLEDERKQHQVTLAEKDEIIKDLMVKLEDTCKRTIKDLTKKVSEQQHTIERNNTEIEDKTAKLHQQYLSFWSITDLLEASKSLRVLDEQDHRNKIDAKETEIKEHAKLLSIKAKEIEDLKNKLATHCKWVKILQREKRDEFKAQEIESERQTTVLATKADEIADLKGEISDLKGEISEHSDALSAEKNKTAYLKARVIAQQETIDSTEINVKDFKQTIIAKSGKIVKLTTRIETMESKIEEHQRTIAAKEKENTDLTMGIRIAEVKAKNYEQITAAKGREITELTKQKDSEIQARRRLQTAANMKVQDLQKRHRDEDEQLRKQMFPFTF